MDERRIPPSPGPATETSATSAAPSTGAALQFDHVEPVDGATNELLCHTCKQLIPDHYWHVNGQPTCASCRASLMVLRPVASRQHGELQKRLAALSSQVAAQPLIATATVPQAAPTWARRLGPFGTVALFLGKFKFLALAIVSKGKFLLLGLTKATTFFSMLLFTPLVRGRDDVIGPKQEDPHAPHLPISKPRIDINIPRPGR